MNSLFTPPPSPFETPSIPYRVITSPRKSITQFLYALILLLRGPALASPKPSSSTVRLVCISDTHTWKPSHLPAGDVLVHAGDLTNEGTMSEIQDQIDWLSSLPYEHKVVICGNHDSWFDPRSRRKSDAGKEIRWGNVHYLQHSSIKLSFHQNRQLSFYGAPQIPACGGDDFAFQYCRTDDAWAGTVPLGTDVLVTHTPPRHHLDLPAGLGCDFLLKETWRVRPKIHVFGHVHAGFGRENVLWDKAQKIFERVCSGSQKGTLRDVMATGPWIDIVRLVVYGALSILWIRVWGGDDGGTIMVNSSLSHRSTGKLGNPPQVVNL